MKLALKEAQKTVPSETNIKLGQTNTKANNIKLFKDMATARSVQFLV